MSMRRPEPMTEAPAPQEQMFKLELPDAPPSAGAAATDAPATAELEWKDLTPTEQSAASLGVDPAAWKPIAFMNTAHYDNLLKTNSIDSELARRLEAFKHVSSGGK